MDASARLRDAGLGAEGETEFAVGCAVLVGVAVALEGFDYQGGFAGGQAGHGEGEFCAAVGVGLGAVFFGGGCTFNVGDDFGSRLRVAGGVAYG